MKPIRVTIIDDHVFVRQGIETLLAQTFPSAVVSSLERIPPASDIAFLETDLIVCDYSVGDDYALSLLHAVASDPDSPPILVISMLNEADIAPACMAAGASGFVSKASPSGEFIDAIKLLLNGRTYFTSLATKAALNEKNGTKKPGAQSIANLLSRRELEVFSIIGKGSPVGVVAQRLGISVKTVESHRENIKNKLNLHNASEVVIAASKWLSTGS